MRFLKGDNKMKLTKEEQLREAFREILECNTQNEFTPDYKVLTESIEDIVTELLREVSIRFYIKGE